MRAVSKGVCGMQIASSDKTRMESCPPDLFSTHPRNPKHLPCVYAHPWDDASSSCERRARVRNLWRHQSNAAGRTIGDALSFAAGVSPAKR